MAKKTKAKIVFERKLRDDPIAYDVLNNPLIEGDIIIYAAQDGHRAELRVAKIIQAVENKSRWQKEQVKVKIKRCNKGGWSGASRTWELQERTSFFTRLDNSYLLENPPQEILDLFDEN
jgi:hypothetical protein